MTFEEIRKQLAECINIADNLEEPNCMGDLLFEVIAEIEEIENKEINEMCLDCKRFRVDCDGTKNKTFTGCIYKHGLEFKIP